jgi:hypothetical protein
MASTRVDFRCYDEEKEAIRQRAGHHGLSISEYMRRLAAQEEREALHAKTHPQERAHARGVELQDLSMVMGHSSPAVTARIYVHLYGREKAEERFRTAMAGAGSSR